MFNHPLVGVFPGEDDADEDLTGLSLLALAGAAAASGDCVPTFLGGNFLGCPLSLSAAVTTPYGPSGATTTLGDTDGTGNTARFRFLGAIASDGTDFYVADTGNHKIRRIVVTTGAVTTPYGPAAGSNPSGYADGTGNAATFNNPTGITSDGSSLFISDLANNKIRRIVLATGVVTTFAGPAPGSTAAGDTDATGNAALFSFPAGITNDGMNLYVADSLNNKIRQIGIATAVVTTLAGPASGSTASGDTDGTGTAARFNQPYGITTDGTHLYVAERTNNKIRRVVIATGEVTTLAGPAAGSTTSGDDDGISTAARFDEPWSLTTDGTNLYVSDAANHKLRQVVIATGAVTTLAGPAAGSTGAGTADGTGNTARFNRPFGVVSDGTGLLIADQNNNKVRRID